MACKSSLGDVKSSLGDAESLLSDAESLLSDAKSLLSDAKSSLSDAKSSLSDAKSSLSDAGGGALDRGPGAAHGAARCRGVLGGGGEGASGNENGPITPAGFATLPLPGLHETRHVRTHQSGAERHSS